jgi:hypothetical protein
METDSTLESAAVPEAAPTVDTLTEGTPTQAETWDWTEFGDRQVSVKVDGQELAVPLKEALDGYSRQSDYTRKTQEIAAERQRLAQAEAIYQALESDPEGTMQALQDAFGLSAQSAPADDEWVDPTEQRIAVLEAQIAAQQEAARQAAIDQEIVSLKSQYGDFDETNLLAHAVKFGIPNLEAAYAHMTYNDVLSASQKAAADEAALAAKRDAQFVAGGHTAADGTVTQGAGGRVASVMDAFRLAQRMHNT